MQPTNRHRDGTLFHHILYTCELGDEPTRPAALLRALVHPGGRMHVLPRIPIASPWWGTSNPLSRLEGQLESGERIAQELYQAFQDNERQVHIEVTLGMDLEALLRRAEQTHADLVAFGRFGQHPRGRILQWMQRVASTLQRPALWSGEANITTIHHLLCPFDGDPNTLAPLTSLLRDHCTTAHRITLLALHEPAPPLEHNPTWLAEFTGTRASIHLTRMDGTVFDRPQAIARYAQQHGVDLLILPPATATSPIRWLETLSAQRLIHHTTLPILILPSPAPLGLERPHGRLDTHDVLASAEPFPVRIEQQGLFGEPRPIPDQAIALWIRGRIAATTTAQEGVIQIHPSWLGPETPTAIGLGRVPPTIDPPATVDTYVNVIQPGPRRITLLDARLDPPALARALQVLTTDNRNPPTHERTFIAVRLHPGERFASIRARLAAAGLTPTRVLDARTLLDEGPADDVPPGLEDVRLCRVAARLRAQGLAVDSVIHRSPRTPITDGFVAFHEQEILPATRNTVLTRIHESYREPPQDHDRRRARLDATTHSRSRPGHLVHFELDNTHARHALLRSIHHARQSIHLQAYIVADDPVTTEIATALHDAADRGVTVRILVDSLYSLHGSFGARNPLLERLANHPRIEVRAFRPIDHLPSLEEIKQRDHRKLVIIDGTVGVVTGRNLAREYYQGFDEITLSRTTHWRQVPWLDAGVRLEGPAVALINRAFAESWHEAGGKPFEVYEPPPTGPTTVRVVNHRGLRDAFTLETYLTLIDTAQDYLFVVNTFPLQFEVQHALLRAVRRGVKVKVLIGNVLPSWGSGTPFTGNVIRELANELVHSRVDALVQAGGEVYEFALPPRPGWDPDLGSIRPHVHAKIVSADGQLCALGSANLDVTAGYWENEALVVVEDPQLTQTLEKVLQQWLAHSWRIHPEDPAWKDRAERRAWLSRHWPRWIG